MARCLSVLLTIIICTWYNQCDPLSTFNWLQVLFQTLFLPPSLSFFFLEKIKWIEFPWWPAGKEICLQCGRPRFDPWVGKTPWRREQLPASVFWSEELHAVYSPWGHKEWLSLLLFQVNWSKGLIWMSWHHFLTLKKKYMSRWLFWRIRCLKGVFIVHPHRV